MRRGGVLLFKDRNISKNFFLKKEAKTFAPGRARCRNARAK
jgi:hypothetical protein